ncbi:hypothetical protein Tco_0146989, partial [Tanacetum coccineum]
MVKIHTDKNVADLLTKAFDVVNAGDSKLMLLGITYYCWVTTARLWRYALTVNPTIYVSCIEQFLSTGVVKTINGEVQLHALVDGKKVVVIEASVRRDLHLADEEG